MYQKSKRRQEVTDKCNCVASAPQLHLSGSGCAIELRGIEVGEVCQIFERINQAGKPLNIFDIVVAKTYRLENKEKNISQFYLREIIENFRTENSKNNPSKFLYLSDLDYLQILAVIIREYIPNSKIYNITDRYLNDIKAEQIELIWEKAQIAILKTFEFFDKFLYINDPKLIPYRYFYLSIATYFYNNETPDYDKLKKYFWYYSFHNDDLLKNTQNLKFHIAQLIENTDFDRFIIDKNKLRNATYSSKGRLSRAILSLYANQQPLDWKYTDKYVLSSKIFFSTDKPNLHHIFPTNSEYVKSNKNINYITSDSLMNIAYLTQDTNFAISNKNPLDYIKEFDKNTNFEQVLNSHLLPKQILQWSRMDEMPANALDQFIEIRIDKIIENLENKLLNITFDTRDEKENLEN